MTEQSVGKAVIC